MDADENLKRIAARLDEMVDHGITVDLSIVNRYNDILVSINKNLARIADALEDKKKR